MVVGKDKKYALKFEGKLVQNNKNMIYIIKHKNLLTITTCNQILISNNIALHYWYIV